VEAIKPEPEPAAAKKSPTEKKAKVAAEESDEEPEEAEVVTGAMDEFVGATKKTKKNWSKKTSWSYKAFTHARSIVSGTAVLMECHRDLTHSRVVSMARAAVTENVWEEVTDDESDSKPAAKRPTQGLAPRHCPFRDALAQRKQSSPLKSSMCFSMPCRVTQVRRRAPAPEPPTRRSRSPRPLGPRGA
jgi:hypothetical protein